jgi:hypothetical protein
MRNEPNFEIFLRSFSSRIETAASLIEALKPSTEDLERLKKARVELEETISNIGQGVVANQYHAYLAAVTIFVDLAEWKHAIRNAQPDAHRFLDSAKLKASEFDRSIGCANDERLAIFLNQVEELKSVHELLDIQDHLKHWPLPFLLFANHIDQGSRGIRVPPYGGNTEKIREEVTTVAFLKFDIDGEPAKHWNYLKPGTSYDLTIEVRVSNWPTSAGVLALTPVTMDIRERNWLPDFRFEKPEGDGPFILTGTGRAVLEVAHSFGSRPYEFLYAAEFDDTSNCGDIALVGHRRLVLEGCDVTASPLTGYTNIDRHLLGIRNKLRAFTGIHLEDIANTMTILGGLGNIAAQALQTRLFGAGTLERPFQKKLAEMLRSRSDIGEHLQGHPEAAGGISDLTFMNIPIELKIEKEKVMFPKDFSMYFDQTAAYALSLGKRIGLLSVLESSPKSSPVGIVEDDIDVFAHKIGQSQIAIVVVVIRGGFPEPSSYSR